MIILTSKCLHSLFWYEYFRQFKLCSNRIFETRSYQWVGNIQCSNLRSKRKHSFFVGETVGTGCRIRQAFCDVGFGRVYQITEPWVWSPVYRFVRRSSKPWQEPFMMQQHCLSINIFIVIIPSTFQRQALLLTFILLLFIFNNTSIPSVVKICSHIMLLSFSNIYFSVYYSFLTIRLCS